MIKVNAIVTSVRAYDVNGTITIKLGTNAKFDGFVRHVDNVTGVISFERATTDSIVMTVSQLLHFVNDNSPLYAYLFAGIAPINISQKGWRDLFLGAKITFTRVFEPAGTEYVDVNGNPIAGAPSVIGVGAIADHKELSIEGRHYEFKSAKVDGKKGKIKINMLDQIAEFVPE